MILGCKNSLIPDDGSVTTIGKLAFENCTGLTSITIPVSITNIEKAAFSGCSGLEEITLPFTGDKRHTAEDTYQYPFGYIFGESSYTGGVAISQNYYGSSTSSETSSTYYLPSSFKKVTITDSTYIPYGAFYNCNEITSIVISDNTTSIGDKTFYGCSKLADISIGKGLTTIGKEAFYNCSGLESITVNSNNTKYHSDGNCLIETQPKVLILGCKNSLIPDDGSVTTIGKLAFENCTGLTSVTIPSSVTTIGYCAFCNCTGLTSINIPESVTIIEDSAFDGCTKLNDVIYCGTQEQWDDISIGINNTLLISANRSYHLFDNICDDTCNICGYVRIAPHQYKTEWSYNSSQHWHECELCSYKNDVEKHTFGNEDLTCNVCKYTLFKNLQNCAIIGTQTAYKGQEIEYTVYVRNCPDATSLEIEVNQDSSLSIIDVDWLKSGSPETFDMSNNKGTLESLESPDVNGAIIKLMFKVNEMSDIPQNISVHVIAKNDKTTLIDETVDKSVAVSQYIPGDLDGNGSITDADAVYLLMNTFFPEYYPINQDCDFDGNGAITDADAVYLLMYTFFPDDYPLDNRS